MKFVPDAQPDGNESAMSLAEFCDLCEGHGKLESESDYLALAPALRRLARNEQLLDEYFASVLSSGSPRVSQSIILARRKHFYVRAMLWPAISESKTDKDSLFKYSYHLPHDHNFSFMTVGYFGPGYKTIFFNSDRGHREATRGDNLVLHRNMELQLGKGDLAIVSEYQDVHIQFPPKSLSISLNLIPKQMFRFKQAFMDVQGNVLLAVQSSSHYEAFMELATLLKSEKLRAAVSRYFDDRPP